jgi:hypothetical protein
MEDSDVTPLKLVRSPSAREARSARKVRRENATDMEAVSQEATLTPMSEATARSERIARRELIIDSQERTGLRGSGQKRNAHSATALEATCNNGESSESSSPITQEKRDRWMLMYEQVEERTRLRKRQKHAADKEVGRKRKEERHFGRRSLGAGTDTSVHTDDSDPEDEDEVNHSSSANISGHSDSQEEWKENDGTLTWQVTHERMGWAFKSNSCHIDSWLMAEVAVHVMSPARWLLELVTTAEEVMLRHTVRSLLLRPEDATMFRDSLRRYCLR